MRGPRAEAPERTPKAEVRRSPHGAQDSKRKEFLHQQERRRRGLDLFGYFLGQAKKVTPGEGADSPFKNKHVTVFKIELRSLLNDKLLSSRKVLLCASDKEDYTEKKMFHTQTSNSPLCAEGG
jgi:hypothetical protein